MFVEGTYDSLIVDLSVIGIFAVVFLIISPIITEKITQVDFGQKLEELKKRRAR